MSVDILRAAALEGVPHGFLGRRGGVSEGVCAGLNVGLGSDDDRAAIAENRRRAIAAVAPGAFTLSIEADGLEATVRLDGTGARVTSVGT